MTEQGITQDRLAALEQRVGALVETLWKRYDEGIDGYEYRDRLAALRAPGVGADDRCRRATQRLVEIAGADGPMSLEDAIEWAGGKVEALESALATARRERDEAVALLREVTALGACKHPCEHTMCGLIVRARALVAGQGVADPRDAEIERLKRSAEGWEADCNREMQNVADYRAKIAARDAEIAGLQARVGKEEKHWVSKAYAEELTTTILTLRARIAELEARDREGRWIVERAVDHAPHSVDSHGCQEWADRRDAYLSGPIPDPARGLIERAQDLAAIVVDFLEGKMHAALSLQQSRALLADLRAYLGGAT